MESDSVRALASAPAAASSRSLSTARSVLRVLSLLMQQPTGVRADEVAEALGKSVSTAYYLLTSLCEEGFAVHESKGVYRPAQGLEELTTAAEPREGAHEGSPGVDRAVPAYPQAVLPGRGAAGRIEIVAFRGRQGVPRCRAWARRFATAPMRWPWARWCCRCWAQRARRTTYDHRLKSFTRQTITSRHRAGEPSLSASAATASPSTARRSPRTSAASRRRSSTSRTVRGRARDVDHAARVRRRAGAAVGDGHGGRRGAAQAPPSAASAAAATGARAWSRSHEVAS